MSGEATVTFTGNTTGPSELKFLPSGVAVAATQVAVTGRKKDPSGQWVDAGTVFYRASSWRDMAEHVSNTFDRSGIRVTVTGRITSVRAYEANGETRVSVDVDVDTIGPDLRFGAVSVPAKADRGARSGGGYGGNQDPGGFGGGGSQAADPWATSPAKSSGGFGGSADEPPPF